MIEEMLKKELEYDYETGLEKLKNHIGMLRMISTCLKNKLEDKDKVVNDLLKRISNLEFDAEDKQREIERLKEKINKLEEEPLTHTMGRIDSVVSNIYRNNKEKDKEIERLNNIIKNIEKCIDYYAIENDDFSKFYNNEEIEILKIIGSDK